MYFLKNGSAELPNDEVRFSFSRSLKEIKRTNQRLQQVKSLRLCSGQHFSPPPNKIPADKMASKILTTLKKMLRLFFQHRFNFFGRGSNGESTEVRTA
jgi:hypothetical protein